MKIVCPSCAAQYEVPELVLTSRRKMRCARCGTQWVPADVQADEQPLRETAAARAPAGPVVGAQNVVGAAADGAAPIDEIAPLSAADVEAAKADFVLIGPEPTGTVPDEVATPALMPDAPSRPVALRPDTPVSVFASPQSPPRAVAMAPTVENGTPFLAWGGSVAVLVIVLAAFVVFRAPVMKAWPPSTRLYAALGLGER